MLSIEDEKIDIAPIIEICWYHGCTRHRRIVGIYTGSLSDVSEGAIAIVPKQNV